MFHFSSRGNKSSGPLVGLQSSFHLPLVNSSCLVHYLSVSCSGLKNMCFCDPFILNWKLENNRPWGTSKRKTGASYCLWTWTHLQKFCTAMWKSFNNKSCMIVINLHPWPISHSMSTKLKWDDWFLSSFQTMSNFSASVVDCEQWTTEKWTLMIVARLKTVKITKPVLFWVPIKNNLKVSEPS
jgi:hypothetical protein